MPPAIRKAPIMPLSGSVPILVNRFPSFSGESTSGIVTAHQMIPAIMNPFGIMYVSRSTRDSPNRITASPIYRSVSPEIPKRRTKQTNAAASSSSVSI